MKIAVACEGNLVSGHFGHCEGFKIYEIEEGKIIKSEFTQNPGHQPGFLPKFLNGLNVNGIISGGMGQRAQQLFGENNIEVIVGAQGDCDEVMEKFIKAELKSTGSVCHEHQHADECHS